MGKNYPLSKNHQDLNSKSEDIVNYIQNKSLETRKETLRIHKDAQEIRIASCLSDIEIFTTLYYGKILNFDPKNPSWEGRDRFIVSKAHGAVSLYPILADLEFFDKKYLEKVCHQGYSFGSIPDCTVSGFETINGSLGHGLGVGCGIAMALKKKNLESSVFVLSGDAELFEGSVWEAIMFAGHHKLDNLSLIIDYNKMGMLGYSKDVIDLGRLDKKFEAFNWKSKTIDGHKVKELYSSLKDFKENKYGQPKVLIAETQKGKGVPELETDELCHIKSINEEEIEEAIKKLK